MQLRLSIGIGAICLLLSASMNVALAVRVSQQRAVIEEDEGEEHFREQAGLRVDPFDAKDADGNAVRVDLSATGRPTILYAIRPGCVWCERNHEAILALYAQMSDRYDFLGVSVGDENPARMLAGFPLPFAVVTSVSEDVQNTFKLAGTPRTLVIDSDGTVESSYFGAYIGKSRRGVEARFGVDLPEVRETD